MPSHVCTSTNSKNEVGGIVDRGGFNSMVVK